MSGQNNCASLEARGQLSHMQLPHAVTSPTVSFSSRNRKWTPIKQNTAELLNTGFPVSHRCSQACGLPSGNMGAEKQRLVNVLSREVL